MLPDWIGRLLCRLGFHDYRLIEVVGAFGAGGQVQIGGMSPLRNRHHALGMKLI